MTPEQFGLLAGILVVIQGLAFFVLKSILENAIKFEYRKKEQSALVASLFAEWISEPQNNKELNRLTWEATLWLPDKLASEVNQRLKNAEDAKDLREILVEVKTLIQGRSSKLDPQKIVFFPDKDKAKK